MHKPLFVLCILSLAILGQSCAKSDSTSPGSSRICKLQYVIEGNNRDTFEYDQQFRLLRLKQGSIEMKYTYEFGKIVINKKNYGYAAGRNIITLNSDSLVSSILIEQINSSNWTKYTYEYTGKEITREVMTTHEGDSVTTTYTWSGGNLLETSSDLSTTSYSYYPDKSWSEGDFGNVQRMYRLGINPVPTKNLVRDFEDIRDITYLYDSLGNLGQLSYNGVARYMKYICR